MSRQIYVGRLGSKAKREDLQSEFDKFGKIRDIDLRSTHAFIEFEAPEEARDAIDKMDGKRLNTGGDRITVKPRDDRPSGARGPTPRDVCFNCGRKGHWANECKEGDLRDTCYRCYQKGHIRKDCPKSRTPSSKRRAEETRIRKEEDLLLHLHHQNHQDPGQSVDTDKVRRTTKSLGEEPLHQDQVKDQTLLPHPGMHNLVIEISRNP